MNEPKMRTEALRRSLLCVVYGLGFAVQAFNGALAQSCQGSMSRSQHDQLANALFAISMDVTAERSAEQGKQEVSTLPDGRLVEFAGNGFLIAKDGSVGYILTAKHVVRYICSGIYTSGDKTADTTVYVTWPAGGIAATAPASIEGPKNQICDPATTDSGLGADLALLTVDLTRLGASPSQFFSLPIATRQDAVFSDYSVSGFTPDNNYQRITELRGSAAPLSQAGTPVPDVFTVSAAPQHGYSGSAVLGLSDQNMAVVGVLTDLSAWKTLEVNRPEGDVTQGAFDPYFNEALQLKLASALTGVALDLAVLRPIVPTFPTLSNPTVDALMALATKPDSPQNRAAVLSLAHRLSSIEQAIAVRKYLDQQRTNTISAWFVGKMAEAEYGWCWYTSTFGEDMIRRADLAAHHNIAVTDLATFASYSLDTLDHLPSDSDERSKALDLAYSVLTQIADAADAAIRPFKRVDLENARIASATELARAAPSSIAFARLDGAVADATSNNAISLDALERVADVKLELAASAPDLATRTKLSTEAFETYSAIISSPESTADTKTRLLNSGEVARSLGGIQALGTGR